MARLGIISDTHGLLRPEALAILSGCDHIVHAGDIGTPKILQALTALAPTTAVRGNNDEGAWAEALPYTASLHFAGIFIYMVHDLAGLAVDPAATGIQVIVSGHSHKPRIEHRNDICFINPGAAGPRRFSLPVSVADLVVDNGRIASRIVNLEIPPKGARKA